MSASHFEAKKNLKEKKTFFFQKFQHPSQIHLRLKKMKFDFHISIFMGMAKKTFLQKYFFNTYFCCSFQKIRIRIHSYFHLLVCYIPVK